MKKTIVFTLLLLCELYLCQCSSSKKLNLMDFISGKSWVVNSLMGQPLNMENFTKGAPFFNFGSSGILTGNTGCNNFNGKFSLDGNKIALDPGAMTKMMCPGTGENDFLNAVKLVNGLKSDGQTLKLLNGAQEVMSLLPK